MNPEPVIIAGRPVSRSEPPLVIAEMSGNHQGSLERAMALVEAAAASGVHALKLQTYTPDTMTLDLREGDFFIDDPASIWHGRSLYELYQEAHTPWEWHGPVFERARKLGLIVFSTPFDATAVDFLEKLDVPAYKIASFENTDHHLLRRVAATGKPVLMSCGMASLAELAESVEVLDRAGCRQLVLLKCTSSYPAPAAASNLATIPRLRELFGAEVGVSDHTLGVGVGVAAVTLGATVIEKHFILDRATGGVDAAFSLEPAEMGRLVRESERAWQALGRVSFGPTEREKKSLRFRRSLYVVKDMKAGERFSPENLRAIRPGFGLAPKYYDLLLGKRVNRDLARGTAVSWDVLG